jgi:hypothetical protein
VAAGEGAVTVGEAHFLTTIVCIAVILDRGPRGDEPQTRTPSTRVRIGVPQKKMKKSSGPRRVSRIPA